MISILKKPLPFRGGIKLPPYKVIPAQQDLQQAVLPSRIKIPLRQAAGAAARPLVKPGDPVRKGQLIAAAAGPAGVPLYAGASGRVSEIARYPLPDPAGTKTGCIVIETDGKDTWAETWPPVTDYASLSPLAVQQKIRASGIAGPGGAGFPAAVKAAPGPGIELLILNAAEPEPGIGCDESLIRHRSGAVIKGFEILAYALQANDRVIAIEEHRAELIGILQKAIRDYAGTDIRLMCLSDLYPAGAERPLIKAITGLDVPAGGLPADIGVACYQVGAAVAVKQAIMDSEPLLSRVVTLTGPGIRRPANLEVVIGAPINELISRHGGYSNEFEALLIGGPLTGFRLQDEAAPVLGTTHCLFAAGRSAAATAELACIRCGECAEVCPTGLQPQQLYRHSKTFSPARLQAYRLFDCTECGCCAYVCPSHIPLLDYYRPAKARLSALQQREREARRNKARFEAKLQRDQERKSRRHKKTPQNTAHATDAPDTARDKQTEIAAAVARVREKRRLLNR